MKLQQLIIENQIFIKNGFIEYLPLFFSQSFPLPINLEYLGDTFQQIPGVTTMEHKYTLSIESYSSIEGYLTDCFQAHGRKKIRKKIKTIEEQSVEVLHNNLSDLEQLFIFNKERFGSESTTTIL